MLPPQMDSCELWLVESEMMIRSSSLADDELGSRTRISARSFGALDDLRCCGR